MSEQEKINDIRYSVEDIVGNFADDYNDRQAIVNNLLNDIVEDVSVTADKAFNYSDIRIAFVRVLKSRLGIED